MLAALQRQPCHAAAQPRSAGGRANKLVEHGRTSQHMAVTCDAMPYVFCGRLSLGHAKAAPYSSSACHGLDISSAPGTFAGIQCANPNPAPAPQRRAVLRVLSILIPVRSGFYLVHASPAGVAFMRTWLGRFAVSDDGEQWDKEAFKETLHYKVSPIRRDSISTSSRPRGKLYRSPSDRGVNLPLSPR